MFEEDLSHVTPRDCAACGRAIPLARLDALPNTRLCIHCGGHQADRVVHDPETLCAKSSQSSQNGFAKSD